MKRANMALILLVLVIGIPVYGQLRRGDRDFNLYRFSQAIPSYEKAFRTSNKQIQAKAAERLGDCYRLINEAQQARSWYSKAAEFEDIPPIVYFHLGQALRTCGEYEKAKEAFNEFAKRNPADSRGSLFAGYSMQPLIFDPTLSEYEIKNMQSVNSGWSDFSPITHKDGILFVSDRGKSLSQGGIFKWTNYNYLNLYYSEPSVHKDLWSDFSAPKPAGDKLNQPHHDGPAFIVSDNSRIYITRTTTNRVKKGKETIATRKLKIYIVETLGSKTVQEPFQLNSDDYSVAHATLTTDGKTIIFSSDKPGGFGGMDLYYSKQSGGKWSSPINLGPTINTTENDVFPYLLNDTILYFSSAGHPGYGGLDLYRSKLIKDFVWGEVEGLKFPLNSSYDDFGIMFNKGQPSGFFSSNRPGGYGKDDIYAFRSRKLPFPLEASLKIDSKTGLRVGKEAMMNGFVKDKQTLKPIEGSKVFVVNTGTNKVNVLESGPDGSYKTPIQKGVLYIVKAMKDGYLHDCLKVRFSEDDPSTSLSAPRDLLLDKIEVDKVFVLENIYYDFDKWFIRPDAAIELNKLVQLMRDNPIRVELGSHTDSRGSDEYNIRLSQRRAEAAVEYIISQGIAPNRIIAKGYGETKLTNRCSNGVPCTPEEHQANRRTVVTVLNFDQQAKDLAKTPKIFNVGDEVDIYLFAPGFFSDCLEVANDVEQSQTPKVDFKTSDATPQTQPANTPQQPADVSQPEALQASPNAGASTASEACFGVQLAAARRTIDLNDPLWRNVVGLKSYFDGTIYRYVVGCEETMNAAILLRNSMQAKGYKEAFVVKVSDGKIIPANQ